ncbi:hypothetical protein VL20_3916 [Microcystis panniformis FACHB-1757]|uniref:Uncharacterized protein n=1 Tax=Microcystis panniformis FACHB-1757 TaxID=1638788 RepID=A0A0K1S3Z5_9CHRO|nr:hypothetical protein VL20_3916 [Microcystis panniformis FACHB-1757]
MLTITVIASNKVKKGNSSSLNYDYDLILAKIFPIAGQFLDQFHKLANFSLIDH